MVLDNTAIEEFQRLYFQKYGVQLTQQEAIELGTRLINFVKAVCGKNVPSQIFDIAGKK